MAGGERQKRDSEMQRCEAREEERREKAKFSEKRKGRDGERERDLASVEALHTEDWKTHCLGCTHTGSGWVCREREIPTK